MSAGKITKDEAEHTGAFSPIADCQKEGELAVPMGTEYGFHSSLTPDDTWGKELLSIA